jgi:cytoskeletal protein CcmA (bactofilin family)
MKETVIAQGLTFEGKIDGSGHVRISGRFKGDVHVDGTLTVDAGAHLAGAVRAGSVVVAGEIEGNIEGAQRVELHQTGVVNGDIAAGSLTVADGARMRGKAEFGWGDSGGKGSGNR